MDDIELYSILIGRLSLVQLANRERTGLPLLPGRRYHIHPIPSPPDRSRT